MGILTGPQILKEIELGNIVIDPFDPSFIGPNSVDVRLGPKLLRYAKEEDRDPTPILPEDSWDSTKDEVDPASGRVAVRFPVYRRHGLLLRGHEAVVIDSRRPPKTVEVPLQDCGGWILEPGVLYLGQTAEWTESLGVVPYIDGRSSLGRLGVFCHATAGRGDDGFRGRFTLEISVVERVLIFPFDRWFQITYQRVEGARRPYEGRYQDDEGPEPSRAFVTPGREGKRSHS